MRRRPCLIELDPEIERTFRHRRQEQRRKHQEKEFRAKDSQTEEIITQPYGTMDQRGNDLPRAQQNGDAHPENPILIADNRNRAIRDYAAPMFHTLDMGILDPPIDAPAFEMKPLMFQMLNSFGKFAGLPQEDPHKHLKLFLRVCRSFKTNGVTDEALQLKLFPYSIQGEAEIGRAHV